MLESISHIRDDTAGVEYETFLKDRRLRESILWNFSVIGEAAHRLRRHYPDVSGRIQSIHQIIGFRNAIIHGYDIIDYPTVWRTIGERLSVLQADIELVLQDPDQG